MKALQYRLSLPRIMITRLLAGRYPRLAVRLTSPIRLTALPEPDLRGPDWAKIAPRLAGICGTDTALLTASSSPSASPFNSFPAVPGHEILGYITESGSGVSYPPGTRVVVDPAISCRVRGLAPPCPACSQGRPYLCRQAAGGDLSAGMITGFCRDLPGGWGESLIAHKDQIFPVPDGLTDERAVLTEPLAVSLHAILRRPPAAGDRVAVLGAGTIGLCTVAALRLLDFRGHITLTARYPFQAELGRRLGADEILSGRGDSLLTAAAAGTTRAGTGGSLHQPIIGRRVLRGGFDITYDCVGSRSSLDDGLRVTTEGGSLVLLGGAGEVGGLDWTFIWLRELSVIGTVGYGLEHWQDRSFHTFTRVLELLQQRPDVPVEQMVTHRYPLTAYRAALAAALDRGRSEAVKVVFELQHF
ncbi:MAG: alcohol dehydrogenase catalytic domain-containing protein [Thermaerobacterales bacterium]